MLDHEITERAPTARSRAPTRAPCARVLESGLIDALRIVCIAGRTHRRVGRSLAHHRVVERIPCRSCTEDLDRVIGAWLDHEITERAVDRALASPGSSAS